MQNIGKIQTTLPRVKLKNIPNSAHHRSESGQMKEELTRSNPPVEKGCITYRISKKSLESIQKAIRKGRQSCTPVSPPTSNVKTSNGKSNSSNANTRKIGLFRTSDQVSTITERDFNVSWQRSHQELSEKLWLPTQTDCVDMDSSLLNGFSSNTMSNSWFSAKILPNPNLQTLTNSHETSSTSVTFSSRNTMVENQLDTAEIETHSLTRMRKYQIHMNNDLKRKVKHAMHVVRALYNLAVELCCRSDEPATLKKLRTLLITSGTGNILPEETQRDFRQVPYDIRDEAIRDFIKAFSTQKKLVKQGKKERFQMHFRRKRREGVSQSIVINHKHFKEHRNGVIAFKRTWGGQPFSCSEHIDKITHDSRLVWTSADRWYLLVPVDVEYQVPEKKHNAVALDPGVKIFQTGYDTDGNLFMIGEDDIRKLDNQHQIAQRMRDGIQRDGTRKKTLGLKKAAQRIERRIKNKIEDIHRKSVKFLCQNYDTVIIPRFETQKIAIKRDKDGKWKRKIKKETTREMIRWGHFSFRELLRAKGEVTGTKIVEGDEAWTSKTCGNCLYVNHRLTLGDREFNCPNCGISIHRDGNAARNILIKNWDVAELQIISGLPISREL